MLPKINSSNANIYQENKNSNGVCLNISKANIINTMKRRELTDEEKAESARLKSIYEARKEEASASGTKLNQTDISEQCGWSNQSAFSQFANGRIPLNLEALLKLSSALKFDIEEVSPRLAKLINKPLSNKNQDYIKIIGDISPWDDNTPLDDDEVEVPFFKEVELAAGNGKTEVIELTDRKLRFSKRTLRDAGVSPKDVACAKISGNSMERLIIDGATIGIDTSEKNIIDGEIYAFDHDGMLRVKYLYRMPGGAIRLRSENAEEHGDEIIPFEKLDQLRILGWVFWWSVVRRKRK